MKSEVDCVHRHVIPEIIYCSAPFSVISMSCFLEINGMVRKGTRVLTKISTWRLSNSTPSPIGRRQRSMSELQQSQPIRKHQVSKLWPQRSWSNHTPRTIHTPFPKLTSNWAIVKSFTLLFATIIRAKSAARVTLDTRAVNRAIINAQIETQWWPKNIACMKVRKERLAETGCRTRRISSPFRKAPTSVGERPRSCWNTAG